MLCNKVSYNLFCSVRLEGVICWLVEVELVAAVLLQADKMNTSIRKIEMIAVFLDILRSYMGVCQHRKVDFFFIDKSIIAAQHAEAVQKILGFCEGLSGKVNRS